MRTRIGIALGIAALAGLAGPGVASGALYATDTGSNAVVAHAIAADGTTAFLDADASSSPRRVAVTPDGRSVYVTSSSGRIDQFTASQTNGTLTPKDPASVTVGAAAEGIAVSPDGRFAYVASQKAQQVTVLAIDAVTGELTQVGSPIPVTTARSIAITPDGAQVFVGSDSGDIFQFSRSASSGALTPLSPASVTTAHVQQVHDLRPSFDGASLYALEIYTVNFGSGSIDYAAVHQYDISSLGLIPKNPEVVYAENCTAFGLAVRPDDSAAFATCQAQNTIATFPLDGSGFLGTAGSVPLTAATLPAYLQPAPDRTTLYAGAGPTVLRLTLGAGPTITGQTASALNPLRGATGLDTVVTPLQLATASFSAGAGTAGTPMRFDARSTTTAGGASITRYDWAFGDGATTSTSEPTVQHTYGTARTYAARVTVTTTTGAYTGQVTLRNASSTATGSVVVPPAGQTGGGGGGTAPPPGGGGSGATDPPPGGPGTGTDPTPPVTGAQATGPPPPVVDRSLLAEGIRGTVVVRIPGSATFVPLAQLRSIPVGSMIDARKGRVTITVAIDAQGTTQTATFRDGIFQILQRAPKSWERRGARTPKRVTELVLRGEIGPCAPTAKAGRSASAAAKKRKAPKTRRLWGDGAGDFSTKGKYSSATVRGTEWLVQDSCAGTLNRVKRGVVTVRDLKRSKTYIVRAGGRRLVQR